MLRNFFLNIYLYILYGIIYLSIYLSMIVFVIALILSPSALPNISRYAEKNDWLLMLWFAWTASHVTLLNFWFRTRVGEPCWSTSRPAGATPSWPSSACSWPYSYLPGWPQTSGYRSVGAASQWWSNEGMMVKCWLMMAKCLLMMVKCSSMMVKCVYDHTLISPSLTGIPPSFTSILPSSAYLTIIEKLRRLQVCTYIV